MRKNQITIKLETFGDGLTKDGLDTSHQKVIVYADSDNVYEAISAAYLELLKKVSENTPLPKFGTVNTY